MRERFVTELIADILGPKHGRKEILNKDPKVEYILGMLSPQQKDGFEPDPDVDSEIPVTEETGEEESSRDSDVSSTGIVSPVLNPKVRQSSMGISFAIKSKTTSQGLGVCLTWARYDPTENKNEWRREPNHFIELELDLSRNSTIHLDRNGKKTENKENSEISLRIFSRKLDDNTKQVSLYIVNEVEPENKKWAKAEECIFQPQIRVRCHKNTEVVPYPKEFIPTENEKELNFLYKNKPVLARGFLCSAVWKAIDPERKNSIKPCLKPPFFWEDGTEVKADLKHYFSEPDVRSDFIPAYSLESPEIGWDTNTFSETPELSAKVLSQIWDPEKIKKAFQPLVSAYSAWVEKEKEKINDLNDDEKRILQKNIQRCEKITERIKKGIDLLVTDEEVRIAFCIANKTMALQYKWSGKKNELKWYPFQIAFFLMALESVTNRSSVDREICDLLWVPTGTGKTEAYLAISAFILSYRRRKAISKKEGNRTGAGVGVISRYTLRLLTIQQFRRTLKMITALEYLRVMGLGKNTQVGWRPDLCPLKEDLIWGTSPFSIGLWVGGKVAPNKFKIRYPYAGAFDLLEGARGNGNPAQVTQCPCCDSILVIPKCGFPENEYTIHFVTKVSVEKDKLEKLIPAIKEIQINEKEIVKDIEIQKDQLTDNLTFSITLKVEGTTLTPQSIDDYWKKVERLLSEKNIRISVRSIRPSLPGYFFSLFRKSNNTLHKKNFEIFCPNPKCELNQSVWVYGSPLSTTSVLQLNKKSIKAPDGLHFVEPSLIFQLKTNLLVSARIPIPALTVDEQIYHHPPSFIVATVDKFARLPFEPKCSSLFGNVEYYDRRSGYYRPHNLSSITDNQRSKHQGGGRVGEMKPYTQVKPFDPPDLIIQDELHLIEGPLGSLVGIYETAIDYLCKNGESNVKYIASTATTRNSEEQVQSLFSRNVLTFPPVSSSEDQRFFLRFKESHQLDEKKAGRLYLGLCAPGVSAQTTTSRIWAQLMATAKNLETEGKDVDPFWTITGYFNAIRELAGTVSLYRQDIDLKLRRKTEGNRRYIPTENSVELSSRRDSTELPIILDQLNKKHPDAKDALFTTSVFGTGVDVSRIGLMIVHGQPKTTSSYIQATGRVGRKQGALVIVFYKAARPRDLNHYEFFYGYHQSLYRFVEPVTVSPFAPGSLEKAVGPVAVAILRNMKSKKDWSLHTSAGNMANLRYDPDVSALPSIFEKKAGFQPLLRRPHAGTVKQFVESQLDRWEQKAKRQKNKNAPLKYFEYFDSKNAVVLGDPKHFHQGNVIIYENAPQSLRDIEETTGFYDGSDYP